MKGKDLKRKCLIKVRSQKQIASMLGTTPQSLNSIFDAADVRSGTIEKIAKVLNVPVAYFYDEEGSNVAMATGNGSAASNFGDSIVVSRSDDSGEIAILKERISHLEAMLGEKERLIQVLLDKNPHPA